jgi:hypothetical protein
LWVSLALCAVGCGGAPGGAQLLGTGAPARVGHRVAAAALLAPPPVDAPLAPAQGPVRLAPFATLVSEGGALPAGVAVVSGDNRVRSPARPTAIELEALPRYEVPPPLAKPAEIAPLPPSALATAIRVEDAPPALRDRFFNVSVPDTVMISFDVAYGRVQLNGGAHYAAASLLVYRHASIEPVRVEALALDGAGRLEYRIVDAWVSPSAKAVSGVSDVALYPAPLLGGLMFGYVEAHAGGRRVVLLAPGSPFDGARSESGEAQLWHAWGSGAFSVVHLPLARGSASAVALRVPREHLARWFHAMKQPVPDVSHVVVGAELQQAASDEAPHAIAYATLVRSRG